MSNRKHQRIFPAWPEDLVSTYARLDIYRKANVCIHCGKPYELSKSYKIKYTELSSGKIVWWHSEPCCTPDPIEETV